MGDSSSDAAYEKWVEWLEVIGNETISLWAYRDYWRGLAEMTQANPTIPSSTIFDVLGIWYAAAMMIGVRKQLDKDQRSVSVWRLLTEIADRPAVMTRERHIAVWMKDDPSDEWLRREAEKNFDRFTEEGLGEIRPERTLADRERLEALAEPIIRHVNKRIAHRDEHELPAAPTYGQINEAVDFLGDLLQKYSSLLNAASWATLVPVHQGDWTQAFTVPWKRE